MALKNIGSAAILFSIMLASGTAMAHESVVRDARGNIVRDSNGGCVYTKWPAASDECNGKKETPRPQARSFEPAPAPILGPREQLTQEQRTVYFDFNKSNLNKYANTKLDHVANIIHESKRVVRVNIFGYTDEIGTAGYNDALSHKRAHAVEDYLAQQGLETGVVDVRGFGESDPVKKCDDVRNRAERIKCLAPNRRVEVELEYYK